jgi:putative transposase
MSVVAKVAPKFGLAAACDALGVSRATFRWPRALKSPAHPRPEHPGALSAADRYLLHELLRLARFMGVAPRQVHATLRDELTYFGYVPKVYRARRRAARVRERRALRRCRADARPELLARAPNDVWSWDITKVHGPGRRAGFGQGTLGARCPLRRSLPQRADTLRSC